MPTPPPASAAVSVIVVSHNHARFLPACLDSLGAQAQNLALEVIVIDNRSDDTSAAIAAAHDVRLFVNAQRHGYAANCNRGMALARGRHLMLLNPDTRVPPGAIATLADYLNANPQVGMCGPRLRFPDGRTQPSARRFPTWRTGLVRRTPLRMLLRASAVNRRHLMQDVALNVPQTVDWLLGACLLVRREALDAVGPMDEGFPLYVEDIDWARRMHDAGWDVRYVPTVSITHDHQAESDRKLFSPASRLHARSMLRYLRKHLPVRVPGLAIDGNVTTVWDDTRGDSKAR